MKGRSLAEVAAGAVVLAVAAGFLFYAVTHSGRGSVMPMASGSPRGSTASTACRTAPMSGSPGSRSAP